MPHGPVCSHQREICRTFALLARLWLAVQLDATGPADDDAALAAQLQAELDAESKARDKRDAEIARSLYARELGGPAGAGSASGAAGGGGFGVAEMHMMLLNNPAMVDRLKLAFVPEMRSRIQKMVIPPSEGEASSGVGPIWYALGEVTVANVQLDPEHVTIVVTDIITIDMTHLDVQMTDATWRYRKLSFPHLSSSGELGISVQNCTLAARVAIDTRTGGLRTLEPSVVQVDKLNLDVKGSWVSWIYKLVIAIFKKKIRAEMEAAMAAAVDDMINNESGGFLAGGGGSDLMR